MNPSRSAIDMGISGEAFKNGILAESGLAQTSRYRCVEHPCGTHPALRPGACRSGRHRRRVVPDPRVPRAAAGRGGHVGVRRLGRDFRFRAAVRRPRRVLPGCAAGPVACARPRPDRAQPLAPRLDGPRGVRVRLPRALSRGRGMALLGRVLLALQLHRGRLPHLHHRGAGQHTAELSGRDDPACAASAGGSDHGAARQALLALLAYSGAVAATVGFFNIDLKNFSAEDAANDLAGNGVYEFFAANHRNELSYDRHYATLPLAEAVAKVRAALEEDGGRLLSPSGDGFERKMSSGRPERRLNAVLISVESLGAEFLGVYGNRHGLTPYLDKLSRESLWFSRVYSSGNRTVRGMEARTLALPPPPGQSIVRRPNNTGLFSLGSVFDSHGYTSVFAYGGYGYFDNMNAFFEANGYRAVDRRSIPSDRIEVETIWGVADEHLFDYVLEEIDRERSARPGHPVFAHVMTTSNHRPFVYPSGRIDIPSGTGRDGAVKYTDYAIGRFIEQARAPSSRTTRPSAT